MGLLPRKSMLYTVDGACANPVGICYLGESLPIVEMASNLADLLVGKFGLMIFRPRLNFGFGDRAIVTKWPSPSSLVRPTLSLLPAFFNHVGHIFGVSSNPQVVRVNTIPIVTSVANTHAIRDITLKVKIRKSMRGHKFLIRPACHNIKIAVPARVEASIPVPTPIIGDGIMFLKSIKRTFSHNHTSANMVSGMGGIV